MNLRPGYWIWHFNLDYPGLAQPLYDDTALGMGEALVKCFDSMRYQGFFDSGLAVGSDNPARDPGTGTIHIEDLEAVGRTVRHVYAPQGIHVTPWGVLHLREDAGSVALAEATRVAAIAKAAADAQGAPPVAVVDVEPANHGPYLHAKASAMDVQTFLTRYEAQDAGKLWVSLDARDPWLDAVFADVWFRSPVVAGAMPQVYWRMFQMSPERAIGRALELLNREGCPPSRVKLTLDGTANADELTRAVRFAADSGAAGIDVFRRGIVSDAAADALARMEDPFKHEPPPAPGPDVAAAIAELDKIEQAADAARAILTGGR